MTPGLAYATGVSARRTVVVDTSRRSAIVDQKIAEAVWVAAMRAGAAFLGELCIFAQLGSQFFPSPC